MVAEFTFNLTDETATLDLGKKLAQVCTCPCIIFLEGELGAGKTTLVRGFLRGFGYEGVVKSPTYTFVEPYELKQCWIFHFDLYRLQTVRELEPIGIQDYFSPNAICLLEWPERATGLLPKADLLCTIAVATVGRHIKIKALTTNGEDILVKLRSGIKLT